MSHRFFRRASAAAVGLILVVSAVGPVAAAPYPQYQGTVRCPNPVMRIQFIKDAQGQAPGGPAFIYNNMGTGYTLRISGYYGGGYYSAFSWGGLYSAPSFTC